MSLAKKWKMLHLLHTKRSSSISRTDLLEAGIDCFDDTVRPVIDSGLVKEARKRGEYLYSLAPPAIELLNSCVVAKRNEAFSQLMLVDYPSVFVIMPFGQPWSAKVAQVIESAASGAGLEFVRGDTPVRTGSLMQTVATQIMQAGVMVVDLSAANVNVFYELGVAHALGKDTFVLIQKGKRLAADFRGAHYYEYTLDDIGKLRTLLAKDLKKWAKEHCCAKVKSLSMAPTR